MTRASMLQDRYGLPLSTGSALAAERYVEGVDRLLSAAVDADVCLEQAIEADEGFALAHAALALRLQAQGKTPEATRHAERARALEGGVTQRERQHAEVIATAVRGEAPHALELAREHLRDFPRDALVLQQAGSLIAGSGRLERREERRALHAGLAGAYGDDWWFLGAHGFACHEVDRFEESRRYSERSLALRPGNANASHNLAHVFYETSDEAGGTHFLGGWLGGYDRRGPYHCHLSWHLALFELSSGHCRRALERYERDISPAVAQARTTLEDAASLLWRFQIYGCAAAPLPWEPVRALASRATARPGNAFADAHAALAFAAAGDSAALARLVDGLRTLAAKGHLLAGEVVLPLVEGIAAFAERDYGEAIRLIEPLCDQVMRLGGSHAQQEVFADTLLEAYLRAGRFEPAETLLRVRLKRRSSARELFWLGRAETGAGRADAAQLSLAEATRRWRDADADSPELATLAALLQPRT
jgi:tetratricopeptide (TPR) repeat protein